MRVALIEGILLLGMGAGAAAEGVKLIATREAQAVFDVLGPGGYLAVVGCALIITGILRITHGSGNGGKLDMEAFSKSMKTAMGGMIVVLALYILLIEIVGYLIASPIFFLLLFRILGITSWLRNLGLSIVCSILLYIIFVHWLAMVFPRGIFSI